MPKTPIIVDRTLIAKRRIRVREQVPAEQRAYFLLRETAEEVAARLAGINRTFPTVLDLGGHGGFAAAILSTLPGVERVVRADSLVGDDVGGGPDVIADEEAVPFSPKHWDLVVSLLTLHAVNDLPGTFAQIRQLLRPDGLFLTALLAGESLQELSDSLLSAETEITGGASPRVMPFADLHSLAALLQRAGFALPVADIDRTIVRYDSMFGLMRDLRAMGATNPLLARSRQPTPRSLLLRAAQIYAERHADADGRVRATFEIAYLAGWAPHDSQQQPLRPGSARMRLADALGSEPAPQSEAAGPHSASDPD